jgi:hypothetical protein
MVQNLLFLLMQFFLMQLHDLTSAAISITKKPTEVRTLLDGYVIFFNASSGVE